jgi:hypothetical protein
MEDVEMQVEMTVTESNEQATGSEEVMSKEMLCSINEVAIVEHELCGKEEIIQNLEVSKTIEQKE